MTKYHIVSPVVSLSQLRKLGWEKELMAWSCSTPLILLLERSGRAPCMARVQARFWRSSLTRRASCQHVMLDSHEIEVTGETKDQNSRSSLITPDNGNRFKSGFVFPLTLCKQVEFRSPAFTYPKSSIKISPPIQRPPKAACNPL